MGHRFVWSVLGVVSIVGIPACSGTGTAESPRTSVAEEAGTRVPPSFAEMPSKEEAVDAVNRGLDWLLAHQAEDGRWSSSDFHDRCDTEKHGGACRILETENSPHPIGAGFVGHDVGVTSLAMLAFLSEGHTHRDGAVLAYRESIRRGMKWLLQQQTASDDLTLDGLIGGPSPSNEHWIYDHALATIALSELLLLSRDRLRLSSPVESAAGWCLRAQNPGFGWKYGYRTGKNDSSVTSWMVLALKTVRACSQMRLASIDDEEVSQALEGANRWFRATTNLSTGLTGYHAPGDEGSRLIAYDGEYPFSQDLPTITAMAAFARLLCGEPRTDLAIVRGAARVHDMPPRWQTNDGTRRSEVNQVYWYFGSYLEFMMHDDDPWIATAARTLIDHQRAKGCERGSWDPIGEWGLAGGRVYSTSLALLTLGIQRRLERAKAQSRAPRVRDDF